VVTQSPRRRGHGLSLLYKSMLYLQINLLHRRSKGQTKIDCTLFCLDKLPTSDLGLHRLKSFPDNSRSSLPGSSSQDNHVHIPCPLTERSSEPILPWHRYNLLPLGYQKAYANYVKMHMSWNVLVTNRPTSEQGEVQRRSENIIVSQNTISCICCATHSSHISYDEADLVVLGAFCPLDAIPASRKTTFLDLAPALQVTRFLSLISRQDVSDRYTGVKNSHRPNVDTRCCGRRNRM
jgi:hypothetical protein